MKCKERVKMEIQLWRSILCPYELAVRELEVKFNHIIDECKENDVYCPIEQVEGRVKSVSSILEKMQRKHIPMERMEEELEDIAGVRIICQFEEDIETVASLIQKRSDMVIKSEKNYLKHIKQSPIVLLAICVQAERHFFHLAKPSTLIILPIFALYYYASVV